jgi:hypothetical protein
MKKLMTMMLGLALLTGTAAVTFGQDTKAEQTGKKGGKNKNKSKSKKKGSDSSKGVPR